jgi:hypothetical protein
MSLTTFELVNNIVILVMMPIIIWANLKLGAAQSPIQMYFWREHPNFVRASFVMLVLLVIYSATQLLGYFGLIAAGTVDTMAMGFGILFLVVSVAVIVFSISMVWKFLRAWRSGS